MLRSLARRFVIANVAADRGDIQCASEGFGRSGASAVVTPVVDGVTEMRFISLGR